MVAAVDNNSVQCFLFPSGDRDGVLFRFTAPVTSIKISEKVSRKIPYCANYSNNSCQQWIASGSEDFTIKVQKRELTDEFMELTGHKGAILHIDVSCKSMLASSSGDGTIKVWDLEKAGKAIKLFDGFDTANEFSAAKIFSTPTFHPSGQFLAFPKGGSDIHVVDTEKWETKFKLSNSTVTGKLSVCSFSFCGKVNPNSQFTALHSNCLSSYKVDCCWLNRR